MDTYVYPRQSQLLLIRIRGPVRTIVRLKRMLSVTAYSILQQLYTRRFTSICTLDVSFCPAYLITFLVRANDGNMQSPSAVAWRILSSPSAPLLLHGQRLERQS